MAKRGERRSKEGRGEREKTVEKNKNGWKITGNPASRYHYLKLITC